MTQTLIHCIYQYAAKPVKAAIAGLQTRLVGALEDIDPNGENAESGPGATMSSGFELGLEGMVGISEPPGVGNTSSGEEGKSGAMSGDNSWKGDSEDCEYDECKGDGMKDIMIISTKYTLTEAIISK
ncbi:hypothetical protein TanjilG_23211 [Lupinus angustifolius]|uniref:Uncharacterized protein n=1 Tax=Lupinus angustifolius TaxID=3871 RepID=A0A1J7FVC6_LUPAN|nr:hypothetical protein TanjilG_23211 [Lupinus angustifolius]